MTSALDPAWNTVGLVQNVAQDLRNLSCAAETMGMNQLSEKLWTNAELLQTAGDQLQDALATQANHEARRAEEATGNMVRAALAASGHEAAK